MSRQKRYTPRRKFKPCRVPRVAVDTCHEKPRRDVLRDFSRPVVGGGWMWLKLGMLALLVLLFVAVAWFGSR